MNDVQHPGEYIRNEVIPRDLSVKATAELLGVGRPALSNLLNGNASLSADMAMRLEKAFGKKRADRKELLEMQAAYDEQQTRERDSKVVVRTYAPAFLRITASDIERWADSIQARADLAELLRRLIHTTGKSVTSVDFPSGDNSQRHGWDGKLEAGVANPWIPLGRSGWEFGCDKNPRDKAERDYASRTAKTPYAERRYTTFVFVTPRNWPNKHRWVKEKEQVQEWKYVMALDANDLEQWLERSIPTQGWLGEKIGRQAIGASSLEECWTRWADVAEPVLSKKLFEGLVSAHRPDVEKWLEEGPLRPLVISADSEDEALAFLSCMFEAIDETAHGSSDRVLVFHSLQTFVKATKASADFIVVVANEEVEKNLAGTHKNQHTIIVRNEHNAPNKGAGIFLDLIDDKSFESALKEMNVDEDEIPRYARESGRSATILRRLLAHVPEIKSPPWAANSGLARDLVPISLVGAWRGDYEGDKEVLTALADVNNYKEIENSVSRLLGCVESPIWTIENNRGVKSRMDSLFAVHSFVTSTDLEHFFFIAEVVLSEDDPGLDLPVDKRWAASIYGKTRDHSGIMRQSICDTLILLGLHGNSLFKARTGLDVEWRVGDLIKKLLTPPTARHWQAQKDDLPRYAEAAPDVFLKVIEDDLFSEEPTVISLLEPAETTFGGCPRSGLLWALELCAWHSERLLRTARILARLSQIEIEDNWANKPSASLASLFRSWLPQTAADVDQRNKVLERICKEYPDVGWWLCIEQVNTNSKFASPNYRPRWRTDASGYGQGATYGDVRSVAEQALDLAIGWKQHSEKTLGDLIENMHGFPDEYKLEVWSLVDTWLSTAPSDAEKAELRERVRRYAFTRRGVKRNLSKTLIERARAIYEALRPKDIAIRNSWLFVKPWVEETVEELEEESFDFEKREERIAALRIAALKELWGSEGPKGILRLSELGDTATLIGHHLVKDVLHADEVEEWLTFLVQNDAFSASNNIGRLLSGSVYGTKANLRQSLLQKIIEGLSGDENKELSVLLCSPFNRETWELIDSCVSHLKGTYWAQVAPQWGKYNKEELRTIVDSLSDADRPRAAFEVVHFNLAGLDTARVMSLLRDVATKRSEPDNQYRVSSHDIAEAMKLLDDRPDAKHEDLAQLEFVYLQALKDSDYGVRHLEKEFSRSPEMFAQAMVWAFKRDDNGTDPENMQPASDEAAVRMAEQAHALLDAISKVPGTDQNGNVHEDDLVKWISGAKDLCRLYARSAIGEQYIGQLLVKSPSDTDGLWPCEAVRNALEIVGTDEIAVGMEVGVYNSRGVVWRGEGGQQERDLASKYRRWARRVAIDAPFTSRVLNAIARSYERDAERWDRDAEISNRTRY